MALASGINTTTRRGMLSVGVLAALGSVLPAAASEHEDAELFALAPALKTAFDDMQAALAQYSSAERNSGVVVEAEREYDDAASRFWALADAMLAVRARTVDGLAFKLAVCGDAYDEGEMAPVLIADIENICGPIQRWAPTYKVS